MEELSCQPCSRLQKKSSCINWCFTCAERLCEECSRYHYALKTTMHHKLVPIQTYETLAPHISEVKSTCDLHNNKDLLYFCVDHTVACCLGCKTDHKLCSLKDIENMLKDHDNKSGFESLNNEVSTSIDRLTKLSLYTKENISQLARDEEKAYIELEYKTQQMTCALYEMCQKMKSEIKNAYEREKSNLRMQVDECSNDEKTLQDVQTTISSLIETGVLDHRLFLLYTKLQETIKSKVAQVKDKQKTYRQVSSTHQVSTDVNRIENTLKLTKKIDLQCSDSALCRDRQEILKSSTEIEETASSTIEHENDISNDANKQISNDPTTPKKLKLERKKKLNTSSITEGVSFIFIIPKNRMIVGGVASFQLFFLKTTNLEAVSKVLLQYSPSSCDIVNNTEVVLTCSRAIVFVNIANYTVIREKMIYMGEECSAIVVSGGNLIVCCEGGIDVISLIGESLQTIKTKHLPIQMCLVGEKNVALVQNDSSSLKILNLRNSKTTTIQTYGEMKRIWVTFDKTNGLYMKTESDSVCSIYKIELISKKCILQYSVVGISKTSGFAFEHATNRFFVVSDNGKSVCSLKEDNN